MSTPACATALIAIALLAGLSACKAKPGTDAADTTLANGTDPAIAGALGKQIVVDPARAGKAAKATNGQSAVASGDPCAVHYAAAWAGKLPAALPLYPGARLSEAAGSDAPGCKRRIVSFASPAPVATIVAYYGARAKQAGYSVEHLVQQGSDVLGGTRGEAAYYITVTPAKSGGSTVDLVANAGG